MRVYAWVAVLAGACSVFGAGLPAAGMVVGTVPFSVRDSVVFTARGTSLFALVVSPAGGRSIAVVRVGSDGTKTTKRVAFDQPSYLRDVSAGPFGVYAGTSVVKRFSPAADELVRIDAAALRVRAHASFRAGIATVASGGRLWASLGDGRVVRLDPRTLAVVRARRILPAPAALTGSETLSKPAAGLGSVWVLAGTAADLELVRMDPSTLAVRSRMRVPTRGKLRQELREVIADNRHVYLAGGAIAAVSRDGRIANPVLVPNLATAALHAGGLVGLAQGRPAIVLLDARGRILARTAVDDAGAELAVGGNEAWFLGSAGQGNGVVHVRLAHA